MVAAVTPAQEALALRRRWEAETDPARKRALWAEYEAVIRRVTCEAVLTR